MPPATATAPAAPVAPAIRKGKRNEPDRILLVGVEGVGKSSFAAGAPDNFFLDSDHGLSNLDVQSTEVKRETTWPEYLELLRWFETADHAYKTLTIDTFDSVEPIIHAEVCKRNGWANMEALDYAKCYVPAVEETRRLLGILERIQNTRGTEIIILAHAQIKTFQNPSGADYSRYELKAEKRASALLKEWSKTVLFATFDEMVLKGKKEAALGDKGKVVITGKRIAYTERRSGWDAKNRWNLPTTIALDYQTYAAERARGRPAPVADLYSEAVELLKRVPEEVRSVAGPHIEANKTDASVLAQAVNRLRVLADQKGE